MSYSHNHTHAASDRIGWALVLNISFTVLEIIGAYFTNSVAIMADALHDLGDSFSLGASWYLEKYSKKQGNSQFTFGYRRFSLLGALITGTILLVGSSIILLEAVPRILDPQSVHPEGMFLLAVLGILVNGAAVLKLKAGSSMNERMVTWHLMEDVLGWVGVLFVSVAVHFYEVPILDPILSVLITLFILRGVLKNLKQTLLLFLQSVPPEIEIDTIKQEVEALEKITEIHHLHVWSQDGQHNVMTIHVVTDSSIRLDELKSLRKAIKVRARDLGIEHSTVELEIGPGNCTD